MKIKLTSNEAANISIIVVYISNYDLDLDCVCNGEGCNMERVDTRDRTKKGKPNQMVQTHRQILMNDTR